jgi:hypothetical protein
VPIGSSARISTQSASFPAVIMPPVTRRSTRVLAGFRVTATIRERRKSTPPMSRAQAWATPTSSAAPAGCARFPLNESLGTPQHPVGDRAVGRVRSACDPAIWRRTLRCVATSNKQSRRTPQYVCAFELVQCS